MDAYDETRPGPQPVKAYKNLDFLNSPAARSIRVECELTEPRLRFREHHVRNTVVIFGSARTLPRDEAEQQLKRLEADPQGEAGPEADIEAALRQARKQLDLSRYYEDARELAHRLTEWSQTLPAQKRFVICSGGGPGIMEAANRGAHEAGGKSVALGISLPFEQGVNAYATPDLSFEFHYFFIRKFWFLYLSKALIAFPGGFGTMDEFFEMLTLIQTHKVKKHLPAILYGSEFWNDVFNLEKLVEWGTISPHDLELFQFCDSVDEAFEFIRKDFEQNFLKDPRDEPETSMG